MAVKNKVPTVDANAQARDRAGKKVAAKRGVAEDLPAETPAETSAETSAETPTEDGGGIVAEAEKEVAMVSEEAKEPEGQPESEGEPEGEAAAPEAETPAPEGEGEAEPAGAEEAPGAPESEAPVSEYQPPEGEGHEQLIDQYHEALAFGDLESAKALYKQLQEHRFKENAHKTVSDAQAVKEEQEYLDTAKELAALHPELNVDGIEADKVLALKDIYWQNGDREADALRKAVADLYPEGSAPTTPVEAPVPEEPEAPAEEMPMAAEAAPESASVTEMPGMEERKARKRNIPSIPSASAKVAPPEEAPQATRSSAIADMKARRNQA
jgi:hypothetical protein